MRLKTISSLPFLRHLILTCLTLMIMTIRLQTLCENQPPPAVVTSLRRFQIYEDKITLSGHSAGASFSHLLHIIHSKLFSGVGILAGLYYRFNYYDENFVKANRTLLKLFTNEGIPVKDSINYMKKYNRLGLIDSLKNLKDQKVYIWGGTKDKFHGIGERISGPVQIYAPYLQSPSQLITKIQFASHGLNGICKPMTEETYEGSCHHNHQLHIFKFLLGSKILEPKASTTISKLVKFDQTEFFHNINGEIEMADTGALYIPRECNRRAKCFLHLLLHGCYFQTFPNGEETYKELGYLGLAEVNNIILVMPQVKITEINPNGCWDYYGYTGANYATNKGTQPQVIRNIISRLTGI